MRRWRGGAVATSVRRQISTSSVGIENVTDGPSGADGMGDDDDALWQNAQGHMGVLHPELVGNVTREDILAQAEQL